MTIQIINGDFEFICENLSVEGFEYPSVISSVEDISGMSGAIYVNSKFGRRPLSWQGLLLNSVPVSRRNLEQVCRAGSLKTIKFETCDGLELQAEVEILSLVMPYRYGPTKYLIQAVAPDSRFYSQELMSINMSQTSIRGGASIPFPSIPLAIPQSDLTDEELNSIVNNAGSEATEPIFTIHGPGTGFTIRNVTTGKEFFISRALVEGEYITVNVLDGTVIQDGSANVYEDFSGDFPLLEPGDNEFRFIVAENIDPVVTTLNIEYRHAYLGI